MTISNEHSNSCQFRTRDISLKRKKQRGVVLIVSLVFLVALTAVASALMLNTTTDMKMSGASEMKVVATQEAFGAMDEIIFSQVQPGGGRINNFVLPLVNYQGGAMNVRAGLVDTNMHGDIISADIAVINNPYFKEVDCPATGSNNATSSGVVKCNIFEVQVSKRYGRNSTSVVQVKAGIAQYLNNNVNN